MPRKKRKTRRSTETSSNPNADGLVTGDRAPVSNRVLKIPEVIVLVGSFLTVREVETWSLSSRFIRQTIVSSHAANQHIWRRHYQSWWSERKRPVALPILAKSDKEKKECTSLPTYAAVKEVPDADVDYRWLMQAKLEMTCANPTADQKYRTERCSPFILAPSRTRPAASAITVTGRGKRKRSQESSLTVAELLGMDATVKCSCCKQRFCADCRKRGIGSESEWQHGKGVCPRCRSCPQCDFCNADLCVVSGDYADVITCACEEVHWCSEACAPERDGQGEYRCDDDCASETFDFYQPLVV